MLETAPDPVLYQTTMNLMPLGDTAKEVDLHFLGPHLQPQVAQGADGAVLRCCGTLLHSDGNMFCCSAARRRVLVLAPRAFWG